MKIKTLQSSIFKIFELDGCGEKVFPALSDSLKNVVNKKLFRYLSLRLPLAPFLVITFVLYI